MTTTKHVSAPYYNVDQFRVDQWNHLKEFSSELTRCREGSANEKKFRKRAGEIIQDLKAVECFFAFPGMDYLQSIQYLLTRRDYISLARRVFKVTHQLVSDEYRYQPQSRTEEEDLNELPERENQPIGGIQQNYFEVLYVQDMTDEEERALRERVRKLRSADDQFVYDIVVLRSFQDALVALLLNYNIQAVVVRYAPPYHSKVITPLIKPYIQNVLRLNLASKPRETLGPLLGQFIKRFRPELGTYYITDTALGSLKDSTLKTFKRIFYLREDFQELHLMILRSIRERYETPFFSALKAYSRKPTGVFHAMPISRGNSIFRSRWIRDFGEFYGRNMFLAETSATTGGLDSLLQPTGPLKKAQEMAGEAYGSRQTFFVTNGTSTANKIVVQALVEPGDVVLVDRDCHKSHHYGIMLSGAFPVYLDSYPVEKYSMYGAVSIDHIVGKLLQLKEAGRLDKVKMLLLTNCTFDGVVYNVRQVMERVLAIKPDMIFLWDEAWFAFAGFTYTYRQRTAMYTARELYNRYRSPKYLQKYREHVKGLKKKEIPTMPDPEKVKIRAYSTQSTHKTLSSFRQGSMIHIWDEDFRSKNENTFLEAYMTHTSTSPNYQVLASLDAGRRQVQFEGFEMVEKSIELAMVLRAKINDNPKLNKYFDVLTVCDLIPDQYRQTGLAEYYDPDVGWNRMEEAWEKDEFVLDPTKITLHIGRSGVDGDTFKNKYLMDKFHIQINKTSRNTVLFMTNIGTTGGSVTYLTNALLQIADDLDEGIKALNMQERKIHNHIIHSLTVDLPPLPDFSHFHASFQAVPGVPGGNLREAYFLAYDEGNYEYLQLPDCLAAIRDGRALVASSFVIPYPPGFPVLVPGQVVSEEIVQFLLVLDVKEIHGFRADLGLRVFKDSVLNRHKTVTAMGALALSAQNRKSN